MEDKSIPDSGLWDAEQKRWETLLVSDNNIFHLPEVLLKSQSFITINLDDY